MNRLGFFHRCLAALGVAGIAERDGDVLGRAAPVTPPGPWVLDMTKGTTYFVDLENGDDSKDGLSWETAFKDPAHAIDVCTPGHGDVVLFPPSSP